VRFRWFPSEDGGLLKEAFRSSPCPRTWGIFKMPFLFADPKTVGKERFPPFPPQGFSWKPSEEGSHEIFCGSLNDLSFGPSEEGPGIGHSRDGIPVMSEPVFHMPRHLEAQIPLKVPEGTLPARPYPPRPRRVVLVGCCGSEEGPDPMITRKRIFDRSQTPLTELSLMLDL
jgi:hypothetical protein